MLKRWLLKLFLYYKGIRFYKTQAAPKTPEFKKAVFQTEDNLVIEFYFYKEICEDLIFKRGAIKKERFIGYLIQAKFDESLPTTLYKYNNLKFFFNSKSLKYLFSDGYRLSSDEDIITDALLNIYLDFIKNEIKQERMNNQGA